MLTPGLLCQSVYDLKTAQMKVQRRLIRELMIYEFEFGQKQLQIIVERNFARVQNSPMVRHGQVGLKA